MIRIGLSIYLALMAVAGPSVCCCTMARWLADLLPAPVPISSAERLNCCHREPKRAPTGHAPQSPHKSCLCHSGAPDAQFTRSSPSTDLTAGSAGLVDGEWASMTGPGLLALVVTAGPMDCRDDWESGPFVTTQDLLRVHHVLRC